MEKHKLTILRGALGFFVGITLGQMARDFDSVSITQIVALVFGVVAGLINYIPENKTEGIKNQN